MLQGFVCFEYIHMVLDAECLGMLSGRNTVKAMEAVKRGRRLGAGGRYRSGERDT
jgi:hypothetical protein